MHKPAPILMLFDGDCVFCSRSVMFICNHTGPELTFCAMRSASGQAWLKRLGMSLNTYETLAVIDKDNVLTKSDAVLRLAHLMGHPWRAIAIALRFVPKRLRDKLYDGVARNRYRIMGKQNVCHIPDEDMRARIDA